MKGISVRISEIRQETEVTRRIRLRSAGDDLLPFTAGGHIGIQLLNGITRSYSLLNSQADRDHYVVGVYLGGPRDCGIFRTEGPAVAEVSTRYANVPMTI
jgi:ferredoxin-NADP reductase